MVSRSVALALVLALVAALSGGANAQKPTLQEVEAHLQATASEVASRLTEVRNRLQNKEVALKQTQAATIDFMENSGKTAMQLEANVSALYDTLAAADTEVYSLLDEYFSSAGDLYEYLESRISPWYEIFDREQVWDYDFYAKVDAADIYYTVVDMENDLLYVRADEIFVYLYARVAEFEARIWGSPDPAPAASSSTTVDSHEALRVAHLTQFITERKESMEARFSKRFATQQELHQKNAEASSGTTPTGSGTDSGPVSGSGGLGTAAIAGIVASVLVSMASLLVAAVALRKSRDWTSRPVAEAVGPSASEAFAMSPKA